MHVGLADARYIGHLYHNIDIKSQFRHYICLLIIGRTRGGQKLLASVFLLFSHRVYCGECPGTLWTCWAALVPHKLVIYVKYIHNFAIISAQTAYFLFESSIKAFDTILFAMCPC